MAGKLKVQQADVDKLKELLSGTKAQVYSPSDDEYPSAIQSWSRAAEKPAGLVIEPSDDSEVSIVVKYASDKGIDLAVKGGGHSTSGASSTDGGILINLRRMRNVSVDAEKQLLYVEGGCVWSDVDEAAWKHGLATVGGTVGDTGVGGLTLGGGYGHLTGSKGLVIDNVVEATVVVASGAILKANRKENPDLFWALLGAGQNFGVTTQFVLQAYPQGEVFTGMLIFPPTPQVISKLVAAINDLYKVYDTPEGPKTKVDGKASTLFGIAKPPPAQGQSVILLICSHVTSEAEGRRLFQPFFDAGPLDNTMKLQPYPTLNNLVPVVQGLRSSMKGAAFVLPLTESFVNSVVMEYDAFLAGFDDAWSSMVAWELYDPIAVVKGDAGSYANRGYHFNALALPSWKTSQNDTKCRQWARDMSSMFKQELERHGEESGRGVDGGVGVRGHKGAVMLYGNYDQYDEISKDIFGENYPRLQELKAEYDPTNVFNKLFAIQPAQRTATTL